MYDGDEANMNIDLYGDEDQAHGATDPDALITDEFGNIIEKGDLPDDVDDSDDEDDLDLDLGVASSEDEAQDGDTMDNTDIDQMSGE